VVITNDARFFRESRFIVPGLRSVHGVDIAKGLALVFDHFESAKHLSGDLGNKRRPEVSCPMSEKSESGRLPN